MKIPIGWLEEYVKLEHTIEEFGDIMTSLEFMQDGPVETVGNEKVIDLEVRQNRPDILSIVGAAREYAAYINKKVNLPKEITDIKVPWGQPDRNLSVEAEGVVKRFITVEIKNITIGKSPKLIAERLEAYGIPSINNLVDITNYVMLEYGMPMHAFDIKKLEKVNQIPVLTLRMAKENERFETWQGTKLMLTEKDLVVSDGKKAVAVAGVIGGANSDIDDKTNHILLEGAVYKQASIRKTSIRHNIRTEASTRHEKFLNSEMVGVAIRRALYLIQKNCSGDIVRIEDYYKKKEENKTIKFPFSEIKRISGVDIDRNLAVNLLKRLGFEAKLEKNLITAKAPIWRSDINISADVVEDIVRLYGYGKIDPDPIHRTPPDFSTPKSILLEEKIKDILVNLGLDEHITNPLVKFEKEKEQIKLENPLNKEKDGLRTTLKKTLIPVIQNLQKAKRSGGGVFEIGKCYFEREGKFVEEKRAETLYLSPDFEKEVKPHFMAVLKKLGIEKVSYSENKNGLVYETENRKIATLRSDGFTLLIDNLSDIVNISAVPHSQIETKLTQKIEESITFTVVESVKAGYIADAIEKKSKYIKFVEYAGTYKGGGGSGGKKSITFKMHFEDKNNNLTRKKLNEIRDGIANLIKEKFNAEYKKA